MANESFEPSQKSFYPLSIWELGVIIYPFLLNDLVAIWVKSCDSNQNCENKIDSILIPTSVRYLVIVPSAKA